MGNLIILKEGTHEIDKKSLLSLQASQSCILTPGFGQITEQSLKFGEVLNDISHYYVDTVNEDQLVGKVLRNMLHDLDPHSTYLSKEEVAASQEQLEGGFEGIGVSFNILEDTIFIVNPIAGGPSEKVGIHSGDRIIKIDGEKVAGVGITNLDVMKKLKGPERHKGQRDHRPPACGEAARIHNHPRRDPHLQHRCLLYGEG